MAKANPFRFSTEYCEDESDIVWYPHRPYSPSTGRFLSRDPIEEIAFKKNVLRHELNMKMRVQAKKANAFEGQEYLPYVFVGNDAVDNFDLLGLACQSACGRSVDQALQLTKTDVENRFNKPSFWGQCKACAPIYLPVGDWSMAWDMDAMTWDGWFHNMKCGNVTTCEYTVTVGGKCYNAWDVNYLLYGWAASLCDMGENDMVAHVEGYKILKRDWKRLAGAVWFAELGWHGRFSPLPPQWMMGYPSCTPCPLSYQSQLDSVWPAKTLN